MACSHSLANHNKHNSINSLVNIIRVFGKNILEVIVEVMENTIAAIVVELE
jgi:hypothetical protein